MGFRLTVMIVSRFRGEVTVGPGSREGGAVVAAVTGTVAGRVVGVGVGVSGGGAAHPARITQARASASRVRILTCISLRRIFRYMAFVDGTGHNGGAQGSTPASPRGIPAPIRRRASKYF